MGFKILASRGGGGDGSNHPITISSLSFGRAGYGARLSFSKELVDQMSWSNGDRISIAKGDKRDAGWIRLSNDNLTGFKLREVTKKSSRSILSCIALSDRKKHRATPAEHKIKNGALLVKLPDWAL